MKKTTRSANKSRLTIVAYSAMDWIGSVPSLIVHTIFFGASMASIAFGANAERVLLIVTTLVSLEAIYLAIFIQMAVNQNTQSLDAVEEDIDEIEKDIDEIQKDVDDIQGDVDEIEKDIDEIQKDVDKDDAVSRGLTIDKIESRLMKLITQLEGMREKKKQTQI